MSFDPSAPSPSHETELRGMSRDSTSLAVTIHVDSDSQTSPIPATTSQYEESPPQLTSSATASTTQPASHQQIVSNPALVRVPNFEALPVNEEKLDVQLVVSRPYEPFDAGTNHDTGLSSSDQQNQAVTCGASAEFIAPDSFSVVIPGSRPVANFIESGPKLPFLTPQCGGLELKRSPSPALSVASAYSATTTTSVPILTTTLSLPPSPALTPVPSENGAPEIVFSTPLPPAVSDPNPAAIPVAAQSTLSTTSIPQSDHERKQQEAEEDAQRLAERQRATRIQSSVARTTMLLYSARLMANAKFLYIIMFILAFPQLVVGTALLAVHGTLDTSTDCHYILTMWGVVYLCRLAFVLIVRTTILVLVAKGRLSSDEANNSPKLRWVYYLAWGFGVVWTLAGTANIADVSETCYEEGHYNHGVWVAATDSTEIVHHTVVTFLVFAWIDVVFPLILGCILVPMITFFTMTWLTFFSSWQTRQSATEAEKLRSQIDSLPLVVYTRIEPSPTPTPPGSPEDGHKVESIEMTRVVVADAQHETNATLASKTAHSNTSVPPTSTENEVRDECAICIVPFESGHICRVLPCGHIYHRDCIDQWLMINSVCCLCRRRTFDPPSVSDERSSTSAAASPAGNASDRSRGRQTTASRPRRIKSKAPRETVAKARRPAAVAATEKQ